MRSKVLLFSLTIVFSLALFGCQKISNQENSSSTINNNQTTNQKPTEKPIDYLTNEEKISLGINPKSTAVALERNQDLKVTVYKILGSELVDFDQDGLSDDQESNIYHTDPKNRDTDNDGLPDGFEIQAKTDPLKVDSLQKIDSDNDGLSDNQEASYGTDPHNPDTDSDGHKDGDEVKSGYNPNGPGKLKESALYDF